MPVTAEPHKARDTANKQVWAEIIYENGEHSVASYTDENDLVDALSDHHNRAKAAQPIHNSWGPNEKPVIATRIVACHVYDRHPADVDANVISETDAKARMQKAFHDVEAQGDTLNVYDLHAALTPQILVNSDPHDSNYEMEPVKSIDPAKWE